ncbi:MAG: hypothetical protein GC205_12900 [Bacteroidetes bacterium]|nr:hypothetical protein [Bacteroidota bacterium]
MSRLKNRSVSPDLLLTALLLGAMALLFGDLFWHPNHYLFATGGDGLKNYFTAAWAVRYDQGLRFTGMNYPFGEHLTYTDAQPLLVGLMRVLQRLGLSLDARVPGVLNALMLFSLLPAAWCMRRIGRHYGLPEGLALLTALLVVLLSPQIHRWQGHYALGYVCFVPLLWWGVLRLRASARPWIWTLWLFAVVAGFGLVHLYYLMIGAFMLWLYAGVLGGLRIKQWRSVWPDVLRVGGAGVLAFLAVYLFLHWTDLTRDRPAAPFGFTYYRAGLKTVFFSPTSPVLGLLRHRISIPAEQAEGLGYVGIPGVLLVFWLALRFLRRLGGRLLGFAAGRGGRLSVRGRAMLASGAGIGTPAARWQCLWRSACPVLPDDLAVWVLSALLMLFLAMALPFRWGLEHWLDYVAPLKQFRSPGRLVFVFYPVWALFAAVMLHRWYRAMAMRGHAQAGAVLLVLLIGAWAAEAVAHARHFRQTVVEPNALASQTFNVALQDGGHSPEQFQAILALPFYHMGSEKLYIDKGNSAMGWGMQAAYQTGIPLLNVMMSRTSLSQTLATTSLVSRYGPEPAFVQRLDERPILLLINRVFTDPRSDDRFSDRERALILAADTVYLGPDFSLWSLDPKLLGAGSVPLTDPALEREGVLWHDGFDQGSEEGLFGKAQTREVGPWQLAEVPLQDAVWSPEDRVEVSLWLKAYLDHSSFPEVLLEWLDGQGQPLWAGYIITKQTLDVQPGWVRASRILEPMPEATALRISVEGVQIAADGLLVQRMRQGLPNALPIALPNVLPSALEQP